MRNYSPREYLGKNKNKSVITDEALASHPPQQTLLRQNSEKLGALAEDVVLPKSQRSGQQAIPEVVLLRDVESQDSCMTTMIVEQPQLKRPKQFPFFIVGISLIQVTLMKYVGHEDLLLDFGLDPHRRHEFWRFITIMFAHSGKLHLWGNVIFQLILGIPLEIVHHSKRVAIIYVSSVLGGSLLFSVATPRHYGGGASAAVYGLLFSHLSTLILNWNEMERRFCRLFWLSAYIVYDIYSNISSELSSEEEDSSTSHAGHIGGAITGFLVSILVLKNFKEHPWEKKMQKICFRILIVLGVIIILVNIFAWGLYLPSEWNFHYRKTYDSYIKKLIIESSDDSEVHKLCENEEKCKLMLDQYNFNGTISNQPLE